MVIISAYTEKTKLNKTKPTNPPPNGDYTKRRETFGSLNFCGQEAGSVGCSATEMD